MLTRRDIIIKWTAYGVTSFALVLLYALTLRGVEIFGVTLFLPPLLIAVIASTEDTRPGVIFALAVGVLCDLTIAGTFPCVYTLSFTISALSASLLAKSVLQPGVLCSIAVSALTFFVIDSLNMLALALTARAPFLPMLDLALRETLASCLLLVVCHPVLTFLHRKFTL